jgi:hypothetical protein
LLEVGDLACGGTKDRGAEEGDGDADKLDAGGSVALQESASAASPAESAVLACSVAVAQIGSRRPTA